MNKRILIIWLFAQVFLFGVMLGGPIDVDSLKREIAIQVEQRRPLPLMGSYKELGLFYFDNNNYDDALFCFHEGLLLSQKLEDYKQEFFFLHFLGAMYYNPLDDYQKSLNFLIKAERIGERLGEVDTTDRIRNYVKISEVFNTMGDFDKALDYNLIAYGMAEQAEDTASLALASRILGVIYWGQNQYGQALRNFKLSLNFHEELGRSNRLSPAEARENGINYYTTLASIGASYLLLSDSLDLARSYIEQSRQLADSLDHGYGKAYSEALIGNFFQRKGEYKEALSHIKEALKQFDELKLKREWVIFTIRIADLYLMMEQPSKADKVLREAEEVAISLEAPNLLRNIYLSKSRVYEKEENVSLAYGYFKKYVNLRDSLMNLEGLSELAKVEQQFVVQEKEQKIADLEKAQKSSRRQMVAVVLSIVLFFLIVIIYLGYQRNNVLASLNKVLEEKNEEIKRQNERLSSSNEDLRQFAHVTSHDLREPLRSIGSFASLLKMKYYNKIDDESNEFINFIVKGVERMDKLLADLLAYSVVGVFDTEYEEVNVNAVIENIIRTLHKEKATQGVKIKLSDLPVVKGNASQLNQLFYHLIDNSLKFRKDEAPRIEIRAEKRGRKYLFSVEDNGIGMEKEYKDKIFGLFLRLHNKRSQYQGTGVGLSICKKIVEQHKGRIWIDSEPGAGTTVFFTLPENPNESGIETELTNKIRKWDRIRPKATTLN
ncbi:MAG: ATP-binding protein [Bacteroidia bacterium]|nr:ATP-binding protein [Bacteroidia bacterium]